MDDLIEAIRVAVADGATTEQKACGATACHTILTALGAQPGTPIALAGVPAPNPIAGIAPEQALDLVIARLRAALPDAPAEAPTSRAQPGAGLRIALVSPGVPRPRSR